ncbi:MAG TPA: glycosyltransferase, partial [Candidatus Acidoferrales bacterium]
SVQKSCSARVAVVGYGIDVWEPLSAMRRAALRAASQFWSISTFTMEEAIRVQGVRRDAVRLLPLALDPSFEDAARNTALLPRPAFWPVGRTLLSVTRLAASEGYKGVDRVIEVLPHIRERAGDVHYVVVGDGDDLSRHQRLAVERGVADHVHFVGRLPAMSADLLGCYVHGDVFVLPSKGEGFGLVFLEAMVFGKPAIGGAHGGTPDVIEDGASGYLVDHDDRDQLAERIILLLTDDALFGRMGRAARDRVQSNFLFSHFERKLTGYLDELCAS